MDSREFLEILDLNDREFLIIFFNTITQFQAPEDDHDVDAHLAVNIDVFFEFCDLIYERKPMYIDLRRKFISEKMDQRREFF